MQSREQVYNFSSGPAALAPSVLQNAARALTDLNGTGIGILEHSHRGSAFLEVLQAAEANIRTLAAVPDDYAVLFMTASATHHFTLLARNFLASSAGDATADYCDTGVWSNKAIAAAKPFGNVHIACSAAPDFTAIPTTLNLSPGTRYVHFTSNNTIYGTQWQTEPQVGATPLICDASSDIFSKPIDISRYALLYAGAQKNLGPSGISLVIARREFLATAAPGLAPLEDYRTYDREQSLYNTPNTFGIFVIGETVKWLLAQGGLAAIAEHNAHKAARLYNFLEESEMWRARARVGHRSLMNVTFGGSTKEHEEAFLTRAEALGLSGLRGHRALGGLRASIYNAFPLQGVEALIAALKAYELENR